jgi:hypothetical protein
MQSNPGTAMNAYTAAPTALPQTGTLRRLCRTFCTELRRAIELAGEPYQNGMMPPV